MLVPSVVCVIGASSLVPVCASVEPGRDTGAYGEAVEDATGNALVGASVSVVDAVPGSGTAAVVLLLVIGGGEDVISALVIVACSSLLAVAFLFKVSDGALVSSSVLPSSSPPAPSSSTVAAAAAAEKLASDEYSASRKLAVSAL